VYNREAVSLYPHGFSFIANQVISIICLVGISAKSVREGGGGGVVFFFCGGGGPGLGGMEI